MMTLLTILIGMPDLESKVDVCRLTQVMRPQMDSHCGSNERFLQYTGGRADSGISLFVQVAFHIP
jgi:hypothetical protein